MQRLTPKNVLVVEVQTVVAEAAEAEAEAVVQVCLNHLLLPSQETRSY
jgi:hypothetical protein